jgi:hypothetical protein
MANYALAEAVPHGPGPLKDTLTGVYDADVVTYADTTFPSLPYARWALFFDDLNMPWRFRTVSFILGSGTSYLPDFWLPDIRTWFQIIDQRADDWFDHLQHWREFALAADVDGYIAETLPDTAAMSADELADLDLDEEDLDLAQCARVRRPLPPEWETREALYCGGGIPDPRSMQEFGPVPNPSGSMRILGDSGYQWTRCPSCGYVGAEFNGRADRLGCGHGDIERDKNYRANDPYLLGAYALARRATPARYDGVCAGCENPFPRRALVLHGPRVGRRNWYHATCWRPLVASDEDETGGEAQATCQGQSDGGVSLNRGEFVGELIDLAGGDAGHANEV